MAREKPALTDERMDQIISLILRVGVGLAALIVFAGGIYYLARHGGQLPQYHTFRGQLHHRYYRAAA